MNLFYPINPTQYQRWTNRPNPYQNYIHIRNYNLYALCYYFIVPSHSLMVQQQIKYEEKSNANNKNQQQQKNIPKKRETKTLKPKLASKLKTKIQKKC